MLGEFDANKNGVIELDEFDVLFRYRAAAPRDLPLLVLP